MDTLPAQENNDDYITSIFEQLRDRLLCSYCKAVVSCVKSQTCQHQLCSSCVTSAVCPCCNCPITCTESQLLNNIVTGLKYAVDSLVSRDLLQKDSPLHLDGTGEDKSVVKDVEEQVDSTVTPSSVNKVVHDADSYSEPLLEFRPSTKWDQKRNSKGESILHVACKKNDIDSVERMLKEGANPNTKDYAGWTPLHEAVLNNNLIIVKALLAAGALVNVPGLEYATPLHTGASVGSSEDILITLLEHGARLTNRNIHGQTPVDVAKNEHIAKMLKRGVPVSNTSRIGLCTAKFPVVFISNKIDGKLKEEFKVFKRRNQAKIVSSFTKDVSHVVVPHNERNVCPSVPYTLTGILQGAVIVNSKWMMDSIAEGMLVPFEKYEVNGTIEYPDSDGPRKARLNFAKLLPPLLDGCQVFVHSNWDTGAMFDKNTVLDLVKCSGAKLLMRSPNPEFVETNKFLFHCTPGSSMENTCTIILYQEDHKEPAIKYNTPYVKTLPLSWFLKCIETFSIAELSSV